MGEVERRRPWAAAMWGLEAVWEDGDRDQEAQAK